ncbi:hypothetical protein PPL_00205 [Heterostelium album PN500]|uniref:Helicase C-terminal domain-containing protein n=1 Tax=Heterostelium pallidum (strain ATCC 26659 / Pp 5 / PN500) TaxID=670386 RepID=D3AVU0_HETP5|nr:hypothetical protein PPL_00205 [Heterostelium album PN500]EFA86413.1 hypothetical protein PPL_00205 [Heterostelium album PN500]|eukprot:XP_020438518.1 hypothetical protein PPL_00205 [Heterostelium album PN500]
MFKIENQNNTNNSSSHNNSSKNSSNSNNNYRPVYSNNRLMTNDELFDVLDSNKRQSTMDKFGSFFGGNSGGSGGSSSSGGGSRKQLMFFSKEETEQQNRIKRQKQLSTMPPTTTTTTKSSTTKSSTTTATTTTTTTTTKTTPPIPTTNPNSNSSHNSDSIKSKRKKNSLFDSDMFLNDLSDDNEDDIVRVATVNNHSNSTVNISPIKQQTVVYKTYKDPNRPIPPNQQKQFQQQQQQKPPQQSMKVLPISPSKHLLPLKPIGAKPFPILNSSTSKPLPLFPSKPTIIQPQPQQQQQQQVQAQQQQVYQNDNTLSFNISPSKQKQTNSLVFSTTTTTTTSTSTSTSSASSTKTVNISPTKSNADNPLSPTIDFTFNFIKDTVSTTSSTATTTTTTVLPTITPTTYHDYDDNFEFSFFTMTPKSNNNNNNNNNDNNNNSNKSNINNNHTDKQQAQVQQPINPPTAINNNNNVKSTYFSSSILKPLNPTTSTLTIATTTTTTNNNNNNNYVNNNVSLNDQFEAFVNGQKSKGGVGGKGNMDLAGRTNVSVQKSTFSSEEIRERIPDELFKNVALMLKDVIVDIRYSEAYLPELQPLPNDMNKQLSVALQKMGYNQLYSHQLECRQHVLGGRDTIITTPTSSAHTYSGVMGCHFVNLLRRIANYHSILAGNNNSSAVAGGQSTLQYILASATIGNPKHMTMKMYVKAYYSSLSNKHKQETLNQLKTGQVKVIVASNALEAGVDIPELDACLIIGYPGSKMSWKQRVGRVGRSKKGLVIFIPTTNSPTDRYYAQNMSALLDGETESLSFNGDFPTILSSHLMCAANEIGIQVDYQLLEQRFGPQAKAIVDRLLAEGKIKVDSFGNKVLWRSSDYTHNTLSIRGGSGLNDVVNAKIGSATGIQVEQMTKLQAISRLFPGAIFIAHSSGSEMVDSYQVQELNLANHGSNGVAILKKISIPRNSRITTTPFKSSSVEMLSVLQRKTIPLACGPVLQLTFGVAKYSTMVRGYEKRTYSQLSSNLGHSNNLIDDSHLTSSYESETFNLKTTYEVHYEAPCLEFTLLDITNTKKEYEPKINDLVEMGELMVTLHTMVHQMLATVPSLLLTSRNDVEESIPDGKTTTTQQQQLQQSSLAMGRSNRNLDLNNLLEHQGDRIYLCIELPPCPSCADEYENENTLSEDLGCVFCLHSNHCHKALLKSMGLSLFVSNNDNVDNESEINQ